MRWSIWVVSMAAAAGCAESGSADGESHEVLAVIGSFERGASDTEWIGFEQAEVVDEDGDPTCVWQRELVAVALAMDDCGDCELDLRVTEVQAADSLDLCGDDEMLQAGVQLTFVPRRVGSMVGSVRVDHGEGAQALGTAVFDGDALTWRRLVWLSESTAESAAYHGAKDLQAPPRVVAP